MNEHLRNKTLAVAKAAQLMLKKGGTELAIAIAEAKRLNETPFFRFTKLVSLSQISGMYRVENPDHYGTFYLYSSNSGKEPPDDGIPAVNTRGLVMLVREYRRRHKTPF